MAYIKTLKDNELIGGQDNTDVYPITSTQAVYSQKQNGSAPEGKKVLLEERLTDIENQIDTPVGTDDIVDGAVVTRKIADSAVTTSKIDNGAVTSEKIASSAVTNDKIANGTITGDKFTDDSIDGSKIKDNSVPGSKLADGAIESIDLQDNTLSGSKLADNSVDGDKLVDGAVTSAKLKDNSIDGSKIADSTIQSLDIKDGTISGAKLANNTITGDKLADGIIDNSKIANNTITGDKFLDESISGEKIQANTIHGSKLETGTVDGADIIDGTLHGSKIADVSVDGTKLADDSIETRHIKSNTISGSKIVANSIDDTKIRNNSLIGDNFADGAITNSKITDDAVTNSKIANNTIASDKIVDEAITTAKLANGSIGGTSIADNAITNAKLQDNSIVNRNIATGTLTGDKFVDNTITGDKILDNTIPGSKIKDGTIENVDIKDNTLSGAKLVNNSISGSKIADNAITSSHLMDNSIPASKILDGTIENIDIKDGTLEGSKIKDNTITGAKLVNGVIASDKIANNSITSDKIANLAVTENKIINSAVTENKLGTGSVTTNKIVDDAVTTAKLADENVTTAKIADGAVTEAKLADGAITADKIADDVITELQTIMDQAPTQNSDRPVMSGGVYDALATKQNTINDLSDIRSGAAAGATAIQTETDPTVPAWAKQSEKPTYVAAEVGALPDTTVIPELPNIHNGHEYVEIAGIKWATMNIGAESETDAGLYFQWGDTQGYTADQVGSGAGKKYFGWADYKYGNGGDTAADMTKYNATDGKTVLDIEDDAARANWGGSWRMPTKDELQAFGNAVNAVYTTNYNGSGVNGFLCTDKTDSSKKLFIPSMGDCGNGSIHYVGSYGCYWASSLLSDSVLDAYALELVNNSIYWGSSSSSRFGGCTIRPVLDDNITPPSKLHKVAVTGDYNDLKNRPTPTTIEGPATDEDFREAEVTNRALTPGNLYAITDWVRSTYAYPANSPYFVGLDEMANVILENQNAIGSLATVATSGDYNDLENRPTIPAEQVQSDWNQTNNNSKDFIKNKPTIPTVPTNVSAFTNDAGYITQHQDISGKEDITTIVSPVNQTDATLPITALTCEVGKYYRIDVAVDTLAITLPAITDLTTVKTIVIYLTGGTTPAITISSSDSKDVYYQDGFEIESGSVYEINALFNGAAWIVASVKINVE